MSAMDPPPSGESRAGRAGPEGSSTQQSAEAKRGPGGSAPGEEPDAATGNGPDDALLPVRMLNEYTYCARLFHLMRVEGRWADNAYTVEGRHTHSRVDKMDHVLPDPERDGDAEATDAGDADDAPEITRSVSLGSERLGITAKLDLVSTAGDEAVPAESKRGRVPNNPERSWEPERVQLMAQGLLLRDHGYRCDHGVLYFAGSRSRVDVPFTTDLESRTLTLIAAARQAATRTTLPDPLEDSPKCNGCSLAPICLPDETLALRDVPPDPAAPRVRRLYPAREEAQPLYVQEQGARVGKTRGSLIVRNHRKEELTRVKLKDVSQLVLCGSVTVSAPTFHLLCEAGIPVVHLSRGHWFYGMTTGMALRNAYNRAAQFRAAADPGRCLSLGRAVIGAKAWNQRTLLRRNAAPSPSAALRDIGDRLPQVDQATSRASLLGLEGAAAAAYFAHFGSMLRARTIETEWDFHRRNRRPPQDPINALLSFGYALLSKDCTVAAAAEGLDPWWGLYHQPRHGRPALALDLMEEIRPLIVDSAVVTAVNTGMLKPTHFTRSTAGCVLTDAGRKAFIRAYEGRLEQLVTHPLFGYRCTWRAIVGMQARLLARWLRGDVPSYTGVRAR